MMPRTIVLLFMLAALVWSAGVQAQAITPYGMPLGLDDAKKAAAAAEAEASKITTTPT
jgi:hypothetical protein